MNTYRELMAVKNMNWPSNNPSVKPDRDVVEFTKKNGRREGLLYNNRILFGYINPSEKRKEEYEVNRKWILANFPS